MKKVLLLMFALVSVNAFGGDWWWPLGGGTEDAGSVTSEKYDSNRYREYGSGSWSDYKQKFEADERAREASEARRLKEEQDLADWHEAFVDEGFRIDAAEREAAAREAMALEDADAAGVQSSSRIGELIEPKSFSDYVQVIADIAANSSEPGRAMAIKSHALVGLQDGGNNNVANLLYLAHELGGHAYGDLVKMDLAAKQELVNGLLGG